MSTLNPKAKENKFTADNGAFEVTTLYTNETALKYLDWKLKQQNQQIDDVFAFVTDEARNNTLNGFRDKFKQYNFTIHDVPLLNNGDLKGSFASISKMFDVLNKEFTDNKDEIVIHFDMTGGLRHGAVLMLALIQMLQYRGFKIGMVLYSNLDFKTSNNKIEDASNLLQMFTLISGADEFTSFGSVDQIRKYFKNRQDISEPLRELLNAMENLSEMIKVCVNYQDMTDALFTLKQKIEVYKKYLKEHGENNLNESELFFAELIFTIEQEYKDILPQSKKDEKVPDIIRWCVNKGFLQQGVVFFSEWLPIYIVKNFLQIKDLSIYADCNRQKEDWRSWESHLMRMYTVPKNKIVEIQTDPDELTYERLREFLDKSSITSMPLTTFENRLNRKNAKFSAFLQEISNFDRKCNAQNFVDNVLSLDDDSLIKEILTKNIPTGHTLENYLTIRYRRIGSLANYILKSLKNISKQEIINRFDLPGKKEPNTTPINSEPLTTEKKLAKKVSDRENAFIALLDNDLISLKNITRENFLQFVRDYNLYVNQWRNQISHANSKSTNKQRNNDIKQSIIDSIAFLNPKYK